MNRSTRFISLSGISGVSTGIIALAGALIAHMFLFKGKDYLVYQAVEPDIQLLTLIFIISLATLVLSAGSAIFFTTRETKKRNHSTWNNQVKILLINLSIPLIAGGLLCLLFLFRGFIGFLPPLTLIFYGLALVNGSKYTLHEIRSLGLIEIFLGLIAFQFIGYGLLLWAIGFGILHIIYGIIIQRKYRS
jgi:hypothetical protein